MIEYITDLMTRAREAQKVIEFFPQEKVDHMCELIAWATIQDPFARSLAELAVEETQMGDVESKYAKLMNKIRGGWFDIKGKKSTGVIEENTALGLMKIAKPAGVIGAMIPCTNCEATQVLKAMSAIKTRNAIIMAPHPRGIKTNEMVVS